MENTGEGLSNRTLTLKEIDNVLGNIQNGWKGWLKRRQNAGHKELNELQLKFINKNDEIQLMIDTAEHLREWFKRNYGNGA